MKYVTQFISASEDERRVGCVEGGEKRKDRHHRREAILCMKQHQ